MNNTVRIQLLGENKGYLDVDSSASFPLTFQVADIKNISKKKGAFSKSIKLQGTANNNRLLGYYFDVNVQAGSFNINKLTYCNVIQNGVTILENALFQLEKVEKTQVSSVHDEVITYTCNIKDSASDFFSEISNKELSDINLDYKTHKYTAEEVIESFSHTYLDAYKYVMPFAPNILPDAEFDLTEFSPGIYARTYWDKIWSDAGYQYNWPSMDSEFIRFSKLLIPYNGGQLMYSPEENDDFAVEANKTSPSTYSTSRSFAYGSFGFNSTLPPGTLALTSGPKQLVTIPNETSDPAGLYSTVDSSYTTPNLPSNTCNIKYNLEVDYEVYVDNQSGVSARLIGQRYSFNTWQTWPQPFRLQPTLSVAVNGNTNQTQVIGQQQANWNIQNGRVFPNGVTTLFSGTTTFNPLVEEIGAGKELTIQAQLKRFVDLGTVNWNFFSSTTGYNNPSTQENNVHFRFKINGIRMSIMPEIQGGYAYNTDIDLNKFIPKKIKQSDFVKSIMTMFNLYAEPSKENPKVINLIPRDEYYDNGQVKDWTKKLAKDQPQEITFLPELSSKKLTLTYKQDDKDFTLKTYLDNTNEIFGQLEFTFDNEYVKETKKEELIFSPTPSTNTVFGAVLPMWAGGYPDVNLRILYDGGEYSCGDYVIHNFNDPDGAFSASTVTGNTYPYVGHWDKPYNPTFDINFGVAAFYFRTDDYGRKTNNNLFNCHWSRTINQINNGKLMSAVFHLNEYDVHNLKLNDKIRINNSWWNINSIKDYNVTKKGGTKVELMSIDDGLSIPFDDREVQSVNRSAISFNNSIQAMTQDYIKVKNTIVSDADIKVNGVGNYISGNVNGGQIDGNNNVVDASSQVFGSWNQVASESFIYGDGNDIKSSNNFIIGNGNQVAEEMNNVVIIGDGVVATSANTLYAPSIVMASGSTFNGVPVEQVMEVITGITESVIITGGTYNSTTGVATFTNSTGGTFTVGGFLLPQSLQDVVDVNEVADKASFSVGQGWRTPISQSNPVPEYITSILGGYIILGGFDTYNGVTLPYEGIVGVDSTGDNRNFTQYGDFWGVDFINTNPQVSNRLSFYGNPQPRYFFIIGGKPTMVRNDGTLLWQASYNIGYDVYSATQPESDPGYNSIYIGGNFSLSGYNNIIVVDKEDGSIIPMSSFGTGVNGPVNSINDSGYIIYFGGNFTDFNGNTVGNIASMDPDGNFNSSFNTGTGFDGPVTLVQYRNTFDEFIYVSGDFTEYNGTPLSTKLVRLFWNGTIDTSWTFECDDVVNVITPTADGLMIGGKFTTVNGNSVEGIIRVDETDGSIDPLYVSPYNIGDMNMNQVYSILGSPLSSSYTVGGQFSYYDGVLSFHSSYRVKADGTLDSYFVDTILDINKNDDKKVRYYKSDLPSIASNEIMNRGLIEELISQLSNDSIKDGILTITPDGTTDTFTFAHGMGSTPTVIASRKSDPALNEFEADSNSTNIIISFPAGPPAAGTDILINYIAKI